MSWPAISIEHSLDNIPSVCCDNYQGGALAARALIDGGSKCPVVVGQAPVASRFPPQHRHQGFWDECERSGITSFNFTFQEKEILSGDFEINLIAYIKAHPMIDGIFATSDVIAAKIFVALWENGIASPKDVQVVGFDGIDISEYLKITTISQPIQHMGEVSVDLLLKRIEGQPVPDHTVLPVSLIKRNSTY